MRARYWVLIVVLVLAVAGFFWWRHAGTSPSGKEEGGLKGLKPKVSVASVNVTDIDKDRIKATTNITLSNPLPVTLSTKRLDYEVLIDSVLVIKDSYQKPITIRSSDSSQIQLPMEILAKPLGNVLRYFDEKKIDSADYTMKATIHVDVPVAGERSFDIDMTKRLPALRLPRIKPGKIDFDKLGLKQSSLEMVMRVENPNVFPIRLKDARYSVAIDKDQPMEGTLEQVINIPAKGSQDVTVNLDLKTGKMGSMAWKMLFEKKDTRFAVNFRCKLITENDMLKNSNMAFKMEGTLDELKELVTQ